MLKNCSQKLVQFTALIGLVKAHVYNQAQWHMFIHVLYTHLRM